MQINISPGVIEWYVYCMGGLICLLILLAPVAVVSFVYQLGRKSRDSY